MRWLTRILLCAWPLAIVACGASDGDESRSVAVSAETPGASGTTLPAPQGPPDAARAERGAASFKERGCVACHTIGGGRLVGPDLAGVHERREYGWFAAMVMNPDSMIREDPDARTLFAEYATPMSNMNVTAEEVPLLWDHIRMQSQ